MRWRRNGGRKIAWQAGGVLFGGDEVGVGGAGEIDEFADVRAVVGVVVGEIHERGDGHAAFIQRVAEFLRTAQSGERDVGPARRRGKTGAGAQGGGEDRLGGGQAHADIMTVRADDDEGVGTGETIGKRFAQRPGGEQAFISEGDGAVDDHNVDGGAYAGVLKSVIHDDKVRTRFLGAACAIEAVVGDDDGRVAFQQARFIIAVAAREEMRGAGQLLIAHQSHHRARGGGFSGAACDDVTDADNRQGRGLRRFPRMQGAAKTVERGRGREQCRLPSTRRVPE